MRREYGRHSHFDPARRVPHFWGWFVAVCIALVLASFTYFLPKGVVLSLAAFFSAWWLVGGLAFRVRFARLLKGRKRSGIRLGGWALDGWYTRYQQHGAYWRAMRHWVR